jgi:hypothetical protein
LGADKYVAPLMHHADQGYDLADPALSEVQRSLMAFPDRWLNSNRREGRSDADQKSWGQAQRVERAVAGGIGPDGWARL